MEMTKEHMKLSSPIGDYPFYVLVETSGSNEKHDQEKIDAFLNECLLQHFVLNGTVANEPSKQKVGKNCAFSARCAISQFSLKTRSSQYGS